MSDVTKHAQLYESLSALVDDEASELEVHRLLAESEKDSGLRTRWYRYQLARAVMRGETVAALPVDLSDQVRDAIAGLDMSVSANEEDDYTINHPAPRSNRRWLANAGRFAVAASVAGVVLFGAQQVNLLAGSGDTAATVAQDSAPAMPVAPSRLNNQPIEVQTVSSGDFVVPANRTPLPGAAMTPEQQRLYEEQVRQYFQELMRQHVESAAQNNATGLMPYTRVPVDAQDKDNQ